MIKGAFGAPLELDPDGFLEGSLYRRHPWYSKPEIRVVSHIHIVLHVHLTAETRPAQLADIKCWLRRKLSESELSIDQVRVRPPDRFSLLVFGRLEPVL